MTYATQQDLATRFGTTELVQLTDRANRPASVIDAEVVARALADADALIDGYLAARPYQLPLASVPPALVRVAADIARFFLHGKAAEKDGAVARAHADAITWLKDVAKGVVVLDVAGAVVPQAGGGTVRVSAPARVFTRDSLRDF